MVAALHGQERDTGLDPTGLQKLSDYWADVRLRYESFDGGLKAPSTDIYRYEMPGGQYTNLQSQVEAIGLGSQFEDVREMYKKVNIMLGDIVKVTPSSKMVGDLAIFMVQNDLTPENIYEKAKGMDFPDSIVSFFEGMMGQPEGGFNKDLQKLVLKDKEPITCRPGELLPPEDFEYIRTGLQKHFGLDGTPQEVISYAMYPKVFEDYHKSLKKDGNFRYMGSDIFFHGLEEGETCEVKLEEGKVLVIKLNEIRKMDAEGNRDMVFEVNGNRRIVKIKDEDMKTAESSIATARFADEDNPLEIGANIPGNIIKILVKEGEKVTEKQPIAVIEAMKMETNILATADGMVDKIFINEGQQVKAGELVARLKEEEK